MLNTNNMQHKNILVIGDAMLDIYYKGDVKRISPEAPVPVFKKKSEQSVPGGATNVAINLVAAGQHVSFASFIGDDHPGEILRSLLVENGIDTSMLLCCNRETTVKTRFIAGNNQQVIRLDIEDTSPIQDNDADFLIKIIKSRINEFDIILFSDYCKGVMTEYLTQAVIQIATQSNIKVLIDVKDPHYKKYSGAYLLKPNRIELKDLTGMPVDTDSDVYKAAEYLRIQANCQYVLTTCGARGMLLKSDDTEYALDSIAHEVFDVTGAGDTTIAYLAACIANGFDLYDSMKISNFAAGLQVSKVGTAAVFLHELNDIMIKKRENTAQKIIERSRASGLREKYISKKIVFTNGCFDILHAGHVRYLQEAAAMGDILVLGLNSDQSIKRIKGPDRPINNLIDRVEVLCALKAVDYIVIFEEDTPYELISEVQPDVLVKGGDYEPDQVVGKGIVEARGGRIEIIPLVEDKSTTKIIERIKMKRECANG